MDGKSSFEKKDLYERVNYLYQAAEVSASQGQLSAHLSSVLSSITKRAVLKLDPSVKRTLCKTCHSLLIPGITASIRLRGKRELHYVTTCLRCRTIKRMPCRAEHELWSENPQATSHAAQPSSIKQSSSQTKQSSSQTKQSSSQQPATL